MSNLYVYIMRSRNKDNKHIEGFKERVKTVLEYIENEDKVRASFEKFAAEGLPGEKTRLYRTVNSRNEDKIKEELIVRLVKDHSNYCLTNMNRLMASISQHIENRDESKWLFDFDVNDEDLVNDFINDIINIIMCGNINSKNILPAYVGVNLDINKSKTPNGYAIVTPHGFDTRKLMEKWKDYDITLKKDELLFLDMKES